MAERVIVRRKKASKPRLDMESVVATFKQYVVVKNEEEVAKSRRETLRTDSLFPVIEAHGLVDDKGSFILSFDEPFSIKVTNKDGVVKSLTYVGVKKERRPRQVFLEDKAATWLKEHKLLNKVQVTVTTITKRPGEPAETEDHTFLDQNAIYVLNQEEKISDEVLDSFFDEEEVWALVPVKA